jgi:putative membrane protein
MRTLFGPDNRRFTLFVLVFIVMISFSAYKPYNRILWFAHSIWVIIGLSVLIITRSAFVCTPLAYAQMWVYGMAMIIGAHFTYEHEPVFQWLRETFDLSRNHYDRVTHLIQGVTLAIVTREILLRRNVVSGRIWLTFITIAICLAIAAFYELLEWWFALFSGKRPEISLGMQGDFWDTQWDMLLSFVGASAAMTLGGIHDRQIEMIQSTPRLK